MIFGPLLQADAYDPTESDDRPKSGHITKKDVIIILVVIVALTVLAYPMYIRFKEGRDKHVCKEHLADISKALFLYAEENTGRLPPLYVEDENYEPRQFDGRANTWVSLLSSGVPEPEETFTCPSAKPEELAMNAGQSGATLPSAFGMFAALSAAPTNYVPDPSSIVMLAETANLGARGTYDPKPFSRGIDDGFVIGFDNSNFTPVDDDLELFAKSKSATRLAFHETQSGKFLPDGPTRHPGGIHILFADGHMETVKPPFALIDRAANTGEITRSWQIR